MATFVTTSTPSNELLSTGIKYILTIVQRVNNEVTSCILVASCEVYCVFKRFLRIASVHECLCVCVCVLCVCVVCVVCVCVCVCVPAPE